MVYNYPLGLKSFLSKFCERFWTEKKESKKLVSEDISYLSIIFIVLFG